MRPDHIRGVTYLALAVGAVITCFIPSMVLVDVGGHETDTAFALFLATAGFACAWGALRGKPLVEYAAAPLGVCAFVVYAVCSFALGKYGMGLVVSAHAGWFLSRYVTLRKELRDFKEGSYGRR